MFYFHFSVPKSYCLLLALSLLLSVSAFSQSTPKTVVPTAAINAKVKKIVKQQLQFAEKEMGLIYPKDGHFSFSVAYESQQGSKDKLAGEFDIEAYDSQKGILKLKPQEGVTFRTSGKCYHFESGKWANHEGCGD